MTKYNHPPYSAGLARIARDLIEVSQENQSGDGFALALPWEAADLQVGMMNRVKLGEGDLSDAVTIFPMSIATRGPWCPNPADVDAGGFAHIIELKAAYDVAAGNNDMQMIVAITAEVHEIYR